MQVTVLSHDNELKEQLVDIINASHENYVVVASTADALVVADSNQESPMVYELLLTSINSVPPADLDMSIINEELRVIPVIKEQNPVDIFKTYRTVDVSHINKLNSLLSYELVNKPTPDQRVVHGMCTLPGNFIVATAYNKAISADILRDDSGTRYLNNDLETKADDALWELEGYRLYRNLNTLDTLRNPTYVDNDTYIKMMTNGASVYMSRKKDTVYISTLDRGFDTACDTSEGRLDKCIVALYRSTTISSNENLFRYISL